MTLPIACQSWAACLLAFWLLVSTAAAYDFAGGTGTPDDPYGIATVEQLVSIGADPNLLDKHYVLLNDLDLDPNLPDGRVFTRAVIAPDTDDQFGFQGTPFTGHFDGDGHKIGNLTIKSTLGYYAGLFGRIGANGYVTSVGMEDASIHGSRFHVGVLAGINEGWIVSCHATGSVRVGTWAYIESIGGLVGVNTGRIYHSHAATDVRGDSVSKCLGGLAGNNLWGRIVSCHAQGKVTGEDNLGGLVGNNVEGTITECYAAGSVSSEEFSLHSGGFVGNNQAGTIVNCYAATVVCNGNERWDWGGLVGFNSAWVITGDVIIKGTVANSFWDTEVSGVCTSDVGLGLSTAQMHQQETFMGWDFENIWMICEGKDYPRLRWEGVDCNRP